MKILYLITKSERGGAQTHLMQLARYFLSRGDKVAVMSASGGWLELQIRDLGGTFYSNTYLSNSLNPFMLWRAGREFMRAVDTFHPDIVSCHSTIAGLAGRFTLRNNIPTVFTAHGWGFTGGIGLFRRVIVGIFEKIAVPFTSHIICVSDYDRRLAIRYRIVSSKKLITIHNGVEFPENNVVKKERVPGREKTQIIFVGRFSAQKDPILLLEALNELPDSLRDRFELTMIGGGQKGSEIREFVETHSLSDRVRVLGSLPRHDVFSLLREADIFVLISHWEGFPRSILEAMSCGLPIIASDVGGVREAVTPECGILVNRGDQEGITQALIQLIENPEQRKSMGAESYKKARNDFALETMLKKTHDLYKEVLRSD